MTSKIYQPTPENIRQAAHLIQSTQLVAFPTETVYGLGANAFSEIAVQKIFKLKGRPANNPLIVHLASIADLGLVANIPVGSVIEKQVQALSKYWPGPLSIVLPKNDSVADSACAGLPSVAVRVPNHKVALELIRQSACPIAAPSANPSFYVSPTSAQHVLNCFREQDLFILDGGNSQIGLESTIISLVSTPATLLRPGAITFEELKNIIPELQLFKAAESSSPLAPGMLQEHYSPRTKVALLENFGQQKLPNRVGLIAFSATELQQKYTKVSVLSPNKNLNEVATKLFAALREHDDANLDLILLESCERIGLGAAIMDRLLRATAKFNVK